MKKYIPITGLILGLNIICVAAETPQEVPNSPTQENAATEKNCKIMLSDSIARSLTEYSLTEYLSEEKSKLYLEPVHKILQEKGYLIAPPLTTDNNFSLAPSGSIQFAKKFAACDAKKTIESAVYTASVTLALWDGHKTVSLPDGSWPDGKGAAAVGCEEMSEAKRSDAKKNAELKSRSDALIAAVKQLPECK
jgi:hypothetical protein